jgi:hypothetical protein
MAKGVNGTVVFVVVIAVVLVGLAAYAIFNPTAISTTQPAALVQTGQQVATGAVVSCPSDGTTDGQVRYQDTLASTITYGNPTVYFMPMTAGLQRVTAGTLQTDGTYSTATSLKCTESGTKWQAIAVTKVDAYSSAVGDQFVAEGSYSKVDIVGKAIATLQVKMEDKVTGGAKFFNITNFVDQGQTGKYIQFDGSVMNVSNDAGVTGTTLTLGTDGYIDSKIYVKTNSTKKQFGEDGLRTFMLVKAVGSTWSEPIVTMDNGPKLTNVIDSLSSDDRRYYTGYDYAYEIGPIDDREHVIGFYLQSASGVNPASTAQPVVEFCAEGRYNSVKSEDTVKVGCWTDAATQVEVETLYRPYLTIQTS